MSSSASYQKPKARIVGLGSYLPEKVLSNQDLEKMVDTSDEWITTRTGIKTRRIAKENEFPSEMGTAAAKKALEAASMPASDLDFIIVATMTPDYQTPSTAALIQAQLGGASKAAALDIQAACTGFLYALSMAKSFIESGMYRNILLVATEKLSTVVNYKDRNTCILFGDGAAAAVISSIGDGLQIDNLCVGADGECADLVMVPGGAARDPISHNMLERKSQYLLMEGKVLFKHAVRRMNAAIKQCLQEAEMTEEQISWVVPHQANIRIIEALTDYLHTPPERVFKTIHKYGNTSASSIAIALHELTVQETFKPGERILLVAFGAGLTWGACILSKT